MAEVAIRTSRFSAFSDITSAYSLAFVLLLYAPTQIFSSSFGVNSEVLELTVLGGLISSFLFLVDPVNQLIRLRLRSLMNSQSARGRRIWAEELMRNMNLYWVPVDAKERFYLNRARSAYWSTYLSKLRAQMSGEAVFVIVLLGLVPAVLFRNTIVVPFTLLLLGIITLFSLYRDLSRKIPDYCWIVTVYGLMIESKAREIVNVDAITHQLNNSNWDEAGWMLAYALRRRSVDKPGDSQTELHITQESNSPRHGSAANSP